MIKIESRNVIYDNDWDRLVQETYGKPYCFQQQEGCQEKGVYSINASKEFYEEYVDEDIPMELNGEKMGITFDKWLNTDPQDHAKQMNWENWQLDLFWERNFYPSINVIANDLCRRGLIPEGEYDIKIDW